MHSAKRLWNKIKEMDEQRRIHKMVKDHEKTIGKKYREEHPEYETREKQNYIRFLNGSKIK